MDTARADLVDPALLASLGGLEIVARWVVEGFITGLHRSPRRGFSVEFAEHRPYQPGDDLRYLDWRIAARADRWVVKQFEEETNLRATLVLDVSASMAWSGGVAIPGQARSLTKLAYAEQLVATLSLLFLRQRDAVGLIRFDDRVRTLVPPRARHGQWRRLLASLAEPGAGAASKAGDALASAARLVRRRGMVVLISDLLVDPDEVESSVRSLRAAGHDVTVIHLFDPAERDFTFGASEAVFVDPESGEAVPAVVADVREAYRTTVAAAVADWRVRFARVGARYTTVVTDAPFSVPLRHAFTH
jgi:uncharacterized protein (DUF58 family)